MVGVTKCQRRSAGGDMPVVSRASQAEAPILAVSAPALSGDREGQLSPPRS